MRDDPAKLEVVIVVLPAVDCTTDTNVLERRAFRNLGSMREGDTYDVGVVGREQALLVRIPEVAAVADGDFLSREPRATLCNAP